MICERCQVMVLRRIVMYCGGAAPMNALGCVGIVTNHEYCKWEDFADEIIKTFRDTKTFMRKLDEDS